MVNRTPVLMAGKRGGKSLRTMQRIRKKAKETAIKAAVDAVYTRLDAIAADLWLSDACVNSITDAIGNLLDAWGNAFDVKWLDISANDKNDTGIKPA